MNHFILRVKPVFKISFSEDVLVIIDEGDANYNETYELVKVDNLRIDNRINWLISTLSFVLGLVTDGTGSDIYRNRDQLKFNYRGVAQNKSLKGCDIQKALKTIEKVNLTIQNNN